MWRILIPLALLTGIILLFFVLTGPAHAAELGCMVYEDDSFVCGTLSADGWGVDRSLPYIDGCIPTNEPTGCVQIYE